ncbi:4Fe-4S binding protein [Thioalkalivibrio sulfidiphilus]|uniref:4Fe-4S binding protein n=1 Tax=Thioalkalivibrio sulfidiphilus TaxID=1033854 RepID=UPI00039F8304|nr:4Fe-4S binding protein [Thioalkalivibrio sulfidiphilus]
MAISAKPVSRYARLSDHPGPWIDADACLSVRFPDTACRACQDRCPADVLRVDHEGVHLSEGCVRCGRCAAGCPTHALSLPGWRLDLPASAPPRLTLDCAKVPDSLGAPDALRVPCLGGIRPSRLLQWLQDHPTGHITLMDRGWCEDCEAGGCDHPAGEAAQRVNDWLGQMGVDGDRHVRVVRSPLPSHQRPAQIPDPNTRQSVSRRGFLRQLAGQVAVAVQGMDAHLEQTGPAPLRDGSARIHPAERVAVLTRLSAIAPDRALPAELFTRVHIDQRRCHHDALCARACPTAALAEWQGGGDVGIQFDPARCIGCGECQRLCPQQAISLTPGDDEPLPIRPRILSRHGQRTCGHCHSAFVPREDLEDDETLPLCPDCGKSQGLMRHEFNRLFGPGNGPAAIQTKRGERAYECP